jgi:sialic acid synthase SpsE
MQIILDMSSGNTCRNDKSIVKQMIDAIKAIDTGKHNVVLKWQLSLLDGINVPLDHDVFDYAYKYGNELRYKVTSSVADLESLKFLLQYDIPFVKLPNCRELDWLIGEIPRKIQVYQSINDCKLFDYSKEDIVKMICISEYPSTLEAYESKFKEHLYGITNCGNFDRIGISDHTANFGLWYRYQPQIYEVHFCLDDSQGLDSGVFARRPSQLREIL